MARKASGGELLAWVGMFRALWGQQEGFRPQMESWGMGVGRQRVGAVACGAHLDARGDVIDNADSLGVCKTRERVGDEVKFHLPGRLCPCLLPVDGFAGRALQAAVLRKVC